LFALANEQTGKLCGAGAAHLRDFAALYGELDESTASMDKIAALQRYFAQANAADAACALGILLGQKQPVTIKSSELRAAAAASSGLALWLVEESYAHVGDLAETCALLARGMDEGNQDTEIRPTVQAHNAADSVALDQLPGIDGSLSSWCLQQLPMLGKMTPEEKICTLQSWWRVLVFEQRLVLNKILTGGLRVGVAQATVVRALMPISGQTADVLAHRLMGGFKPTAHAWQQLICADDDSQAIRASRPYPFFLASPLFETSTVGKSASEITEALGEIDDWLVEWKWDGIRAQLIRRTNSVVLWSRGEERLDGRFPELERAASKLPQGTVLDGEIVCWKPENDVPDSFLALQKRINTRAPSAKLLASHPVRFIAYDCLEVEGVDIRTKPQLERRGLLEYLYTLPDVTGVSLGISALLPAADVAQLQHLRDSASQHGAEGLMLKRKTSAYQVGRKRGDWWKWKLDPRCIDAVLIYAQAGHGRRANLYTDYTFALWHNGQLVPVAKAYSGLSDSEITQLDKWIRAHTTERFGPVRAVQALQVFELGFEAVQVSSRHKSGVAVRFPRILRWRTDKTADTADQLDTLKALA
jgi:DNA ligase 1